MDGPLVICFGNLARGDDGVAHRVADLLEGRPGFAVVRAPLLDVTLAEQVAASPVVVFVDAERRTAPAVRTEPVAPDAVDPTCAHGLTPAALVGLAETLFDASPHALIVSVAAPEMGHGTTLSETAEAASIEAASEIERIVAGD